MLGGAHTLSVGRIDFSARGSMGGFWRDSLLSIESSCEKEPCLNGGTCGEYKRRHYHCQCTLGYVGEKCQNAIPIEKPQFKENSYMAFNPDALNVNIVDETNIVIRFIPYNENGLLFYVSHSSIRGDYLSVSLQNGFVQYRYDLGNGIDPKQSQNKITMNNEHTVTVTRKQETGTLQVDDQTVISVRSPGILKALNTHTNYYLGGVPNLSLVNPSAVADITSLKNFIGCVTSVTVNGVPLLKYIAEERRNIVQCPTPNE